MPQPNQTTQTSAPTTDKPLTGEALLAEVTRLRTELAAAQSAAQSKALGPGITLRVSLKGAVSAYGLGKFPVTLYASQWEKLLAKVDDIRGFLKTNESKLARKG